MALVTLQCTQGRLTRRIFRLQTPFTIGSAEDDTVQVIGDFVVPHHWSVFEHEGCVVVSGRKRHSGENRNLADVGNLHVGLTVFRVLSIRLPRAAREEVVRRLTQDLQIELIRNMDLSGIAGMDNEQLCREITTGVQELLRMRPDLTERERHQIEYDVLDAIFPD